MWWGFITLWHTGRKENKLKPEKCYCLLVLTSNSLLLSTGSTSTGKIIHIGWWSRVYTTYWNILPHLCSIARQMDHIWVSSLPGHLLLLMLTQVNYIHTGHCYTWFVRKLIAWLEIMPYGLGVRYSASLLDGGFGRSTMSLKDKSISRVE